MLAWWAMGGAGGKDVRPAANNTLGGLAGTFRLPRSCRQLDNGQLSGISGTLIIQPRSNAMPRSTTAAVLFAAGCIFAAGCGSAKTGWRDAEVKGGGAATVEVVLPRSVAVVASGENGFPGLEAIRKQVGESGEHELSKRRVNAYLFATNSKVSDLDPAAENWQRAAREKLNAAIEAIGIKERRSAAKNALFDILEGWAPPTPECDEIILEVNVRLAAIAFAENRMDSFQTLYSLALARREEFGWSLSRFSDWQSAIRKDTHARMGFTP